LRAPKKCHPASSRGSPGPTARRPNRSPHPVGVCPNGVPLAYRIIDPQLVIVQVKFDL
jgi:hypothetical protein